MEIVVIVLLILLNGIFSMSEIALVSARKSKLKTDVKKGNKAAKAVLQLSEEPNKFLSTIQIGITLIGIVTGLYSGEAFAHDFAEIIARVDVLAPYSLAIATVSIVLLVTYLTIVFGELVPKRLGLTIPERMAKLIARPMLVLSHIMTPMVWLLSKSTTAILQLFGIKSNVENITEEEIKTLVKEGVEAGEVQEVEHDIVERVFSLGDRDVATIMTNFNDLVWLNCSDDKETIRAKVMENMHDVYPVSLKNNGTVEGVIHLKDLFGKIDSPDFAPDELVRSAHFVPENIGVYEALELFKQANVKYGFVADEFGRLLGIVTLTDIMEALVGEVTDKDEEKDILVREDGSLLVDGQCSFYSFLEYLDMQSIYAEYEYNTLSGLILELLEHLPTEGEYFTWQGLDFKISDMDGVRIDKVSVTKNNEFQVQA